MPYTIRTSRRADADIDDAVGRLTRRVSAASAAGWYAGILARIRSLARNPEAWPLADEADDLGLDLRELPYGRGRNVYRILYTVDGQTINVHRVRQAAQDRLSPDDV